MDTEVTNHMMCLDLEYDFWQRNFTYVVIFLDLGLKEFIPNKFFYEWIQRDSMNVDRERDMTFNCISQIKYTLNISDEIFKLSLEAWEDLSQN